MKQHLKYLKRVLVIAALALAIPIAIPTAEAATDNTPISFRLDWSLYGTHAPFFLALKKGLYKKEGLDVTISEGAGSATVAKQVARGNVQLAFVDFATMIRGVQQGLPIQAVMRVLSGVMCVISHADAPIKGPKQLEGKVMAYSPAESTAQVMPALLAKNGVDPGKISVIQPAVGAKLALFLQGRADAIPGNVNVQVAQLEAKGARVHYFLYSDFGVNVLANGIVANTEFEASHPDAVKGFLRATKEAFQMAEKDPEAAIDALISYYPEQARNRKVLLRQWKLTIPALKTANTRDKPFGWMAKADWQSTQQILLKYAGLSEAVPLKRLYTNQYLPKN